jgi:hypothetical protein
LYGCETLTYREEQRLRTFENRVLRKIFGLKWEDRRGGWGELHHGLHDLCICSQILGCVYVFIFKY